MGQSTPYTKLSDLLAHGSSRGVEAEFHACGHALHLFEQTLQAIDDMTNEKRDIFMRQLTAWMMAEKYGSHARPAIQGLQRYCIADCLFEDPGWEPAVRRVG